MAKTITTADDGRDGGEVRSIASTRPYGVAAKGYVRAGLTPLPLPSRKKTPPPKGYTGRGAGLPTRAQIKSWIKESPHSNIAIRLAPVEVDGEEWDLIGVDVDRGHAKGNTDGVATLRALEGELGQLPSTWRSTAQDDGESGIRWFRVPMGLIWPGVFGPAIDCIQHGHRYAVVPPSYHPTAGQYAWYWDVAPASVTGSENAWNFTTPSLTNGVPSVADFAELPEAWVHHFTDKRTEAGERTEIDLESTVGEVEEWYWGTLKSLSQSSKDRPDHFVKKQLREFMDNVEGDAHESLTKYMMAVVAGGVEGHKGAYKAIKNITDHFIHEVTARRSEAGEEGVRSLEEAQKEAWRSKIGAMRTVKGEVEKGTRVPVTTCACPDPIKPTNPTTITVHQDGTIVEDKDRIESPTGERTVADYNRNDVGNAELFRDVMGIRHMFVNSLDAWLLWDGARWVADDTMAIFRDWDEVMGLWEEYATKLLGAVTSARAIHGDGSPEHKAAMRNWKVIDAWAESCGNIGRIKAGLEAYKAIEGVTVPAVELDADGRMLNFSNGTVVLGGRGDDRPTGLRPFRREDRNTRSTGIPYVPWGELTANGGDVPAELLSGVTVNAPSNSIGGDMDIRLGLGLWEEYLDRFIPDLELRDFVQVIAGYSLISGNPHNLMFVFLGQSKTGKSTITNLMSRALGSYSVTVAADIFANDSVRNTSLYRSLGARMAILPELGPEVRIPSDALKRIASEDVVSVRDNYQRASDMAERSITATFITATNDAPKMKDVDDATIRRLCVVPFRQTIPVDQDDQTIASQMIKHCPSVVLSWAIEGWKRYAANPNLLDRANWPAAASEEAVDFISDMADIGDFIKDVLDIMPVGKYSEADREQHYLPTGALFTAYKGWFSANSGSGDTAMSQTKFARSLAKIVGRSVQRRIDGRKIRVYYGVRMKGDNSIRVVRESDSGD